MLNDPNDRADGQKRLVLFTMAALILVFVWMKLFPAPTPPPRSDSDEETAENEVDGSADPADPGQITADGSGQSPDISPRAVPVPDALPPQVLVGPNATLSFTNTGGRLTAVEVVEPEQYIPHDNMQGVFPTEEDEMLPYAVELSGVDELDEDSMFVFVEDESVPTDDGFTRLVYRWTSYDGSIIVTKTFEVDDEAFGTVMTVEVANAGDTPRAYDDMAILVHGTFSTSGGGMFNRSASVVEGICATDRRVERRPGRKIRETETFDGAVRFGGVQERNFLTAVAPRTEEGGARTAESCTYGPENDSGIFVRVTEDDFTINPGESQTFHYTVFVGPKDERFLREYDHGFERSINFGIFSFLARPIRVVLLFFHNLIGNWGLAIILLTILIKLLLLPLTHKTYKNMEKMREVQPRIKELQEKYKNDQQKLVEEQMKLFRETGTSPLGGCLPMLLQMPIWFALYRTIWGSAELHRAEFVGWLSDLSEPDPYFILPLFMGVVMVLQQRMMPTPADNPQAKMMKIIMPIMFTVMMLFLPSGLVLYICVNMILSVFQQLYIRRKRAQDSEEEKKQVNPRKKS